MSLEFKRQIEAIYSIVKLVCKASFSHLKNEATALLPRFLVLQNRVLTKYGSLNTRHFDKIFYRK